ncbi:DUF488 domain-containing protein [Candidatus Enterococcus leclercqii]|uniref:DUF488 domain-containing protein n=1 Tax=Candidatus Enterococcus leclercqii TaxID=1857218 RepID=UPI001379CB5F|nr:DUF488 domain-containing protein [Enterococcus sp. CU9D]KAF1290500.1 MarR family transcriptional regulator [Enterococcus sp. CU9D]
MIQLKRVYEAPSETDGYRVLVDRVWPRGEKKVEAKLNEWLRDIGPSKELRQWFNHEDEKYPEFKKKYEEELKSGPQAEAFEKLKAIVKDHKTVTLLYGAKNEVHNQAVVLKELLES